MTYRALAVLMFLAIILNANEHAKRPIPVAPPPPCLGCHVIE